MRIAPATSTRCETIPPTLTRSSPPDLPRGGTLAWKDSSPRGTPPGKDVLLGGTPRARSSPYCGTPLGKNSSRSGSPPGKTSSQVRHFPARHAHRNHGHHHDDAEEHKAHRRRVPHIQRLERRVV